MKTDKGFPEACPAGSLKWLRAATFPCVEPWFPFLKARHMHITVVITSQSSRRDSPNPAQAWEVDFSFYADKAIEIAGQRAFTAWQGMCVTSPFCRIICRL